MFFSRVLSQSTHMPYTVPPLYSPVYILVQELIQTGAVVGKVRQEPPPPPPIRILPCPPKLSLLALALGFVFHPTHRACGRC